MANRLTKIYTRTGDDGLTGLASGNRVAKHDLRIEASGTVDEANCAIGIVLSADAIPSELRAVLVRVQNDLFDLGAELSLPDYKAIDSERITWLENQLDTLNANLPPLKEFILPGGNRVAANCHLARAICRRAERVGWALTEQAPLNLNLLKYLNRLSDLLFVAARVLCRDNGSAEVLWQHAR
jgi:cob(I)alamin adenosyltransferase